MKILYIANQRLPTEKAYGIQIAKMCETLARRAEVELIAPYRQNEIKDDFFDYYSVKRNFKFKKIWAPDFYLPGKLDKAAVNIKSFVSAFVLSFFVLFQKADLIYTRDEWPAYFLSFFRKNVVFEAHKFSNRKKFIYQRFKNRRLVVISEGLEREFVRLGFKNILVAPDGVDLEKFDIDMTKEEARGKVGLSQKKKIILYTGSLYDWKGIDVFVDSNKFLSDVQLVVVGGTKNEIRDGVVFIEKKPYNQIPFYLKAADVLVLPNSPKEKISKYYTSPLKLFEYMASRRPIVASGLPSIREILNEENAILVEPADSQGLAKGIKAILDDKNLAEHISNKAFKDVQNYTWQKRANMVLEYIYG